MSHFGAHKVITLSGGSIVLLQGMLAKAVSAMDTILIVTTLASMLVVGYLAHERGRSQSRWVWTAAVIGPFAIPLIYLADAAAAVRKRLGAAKAG
jgi:hypothetical protein